MMVCFTGLLGYKSGLLVDLEQRLTSTLCRSSPITFNTVVRIARSTYFVRQHAALSDSGIFTSSTTLSLTLGLHPQVFDI